jgi:carbonic anhydrase/acetyltransferase-like protein (isoleucine patch superfamily)
VYAVVPSARIVAMDGTLPEVAADAFVAPSASIIGNCQIGTGAGVWYNAVVRGDIGKGVTLGTNSTIQERAVVTGSTIGEHAVVGVGANLSNCTLQDNTLVGVGASVQSGATLERGSVVAAGSVVGKNKVIPAGQLWSGNPVEYLRDLTEAEKKALLNSAQDLSILGSHHGLETDKSISLVESEKESWKESLLRGGDTIMNPSPNHFEDRPGAIWKQEKNGPGANVTYQSVDQKTIDSRTFNRMREYEDEIGSRIKGTSMKVGEDARSIDAKVDEISKQLKGGRGSQPERSL